MTEEQEVNDKADDKDFGAFEAGFNRISSGEEAPVVEDPTPEATPDEKTPGDEPVAEDPAKHFGFTEEQIKSLLERSTKVDSIEDQLRKAYGKIGELNSTLQSLVESQKAKPSTPISADDDALSEAEEAFPEFRAIADARAKKIASEIMSEYVGKIPQTAPNITKDEIVREANIAIMDATHEGWRDTLASQDFALWIATQPEDVQDTFSQTVSAKELGKIVKNFDAWKAKTSAAGSKNKQRLEQALTPESASSKVTHAVSDHDAFVAGFNSVRGVIT